MQEIRGLVMGNEIMVSVCCLAYNHSKYIRQCLDGFVNQKTNFKFEVLIHDDASTDGTQDIIKEYEEKYPDIIKPIYQTENQYSKGIKVNMTYQYPRVKGKYIAYCEGDDYWTDEYKLQKQFDILERETDCYFCVHKVLDVDCDGNSLETTHPIASLDLSEGKITCENFARLLFDDNIIYLFQTSSYFVRSEFISIYEKQQIPKFMRLCAVGDKSLMMLLLLKGNVYYINEVMSNYRNSCEGSFTNKYNSSIEYKIKIHKSFLECYKEYNKFSEYKYDEILSKKILKEEFRINMLCGSYKKNLNIKFRDLLKELSPKERMYIVINGYFSIIYKLYLKFKRK